MDRILSIDPRSLTATVQPGVINADLDHAAERVGLWYAPDPASREFSTIGGNIATNAGGLCCVKYGVTRESVLGLEVVLADGTLLRTGRRTIKGVAGYDLTSLLVGSEGTLGLITEATLRLRPRPHPPATVVAYFPTLDSAGRAVWDITARHSPALLELMDQVTLQAVERWKPMGLDVDSAALMIAASDAGGLHGGAEVVAIEEACAAAGATYTARSEDPDDYDLFLAARRIAYPALQQIGVALLDDIAVPVGSVTDMLEAIRWVADQSGLVIGTFGHAGDGNLHPTIVFDDRDERSTALARGAFDAIVRRALDMGGTSTGEHGVGLLKARYMDLELGETSLAVQQSLKRALDPYGLLNPGKILEADDPSPGSPSQEGPT
jgi:glycolate oxidase